MISKRILGFAGFILLLLLVIILLGIPGSKKSTVQDFTVYCENCNKVSVYDTTETVGDGNSKLVETFSENNKTIRINIDHKYLVKYFGAEGYDNNTISLNPSFEQKTLRIKPYYSDSKLSSMQANEMPAIRQAYVDKYGAVNIYELQPGNLYGYGDWYGTTLIYKGNDDFNNDTLRLIMHKESGQWIIKTSPPDITLSKYIYPDIPVDILRKVNSL